MNDKLLCILGATAVGKSEVALAVAKMLNCDVISCDSMQIYKGMDVGTAKLSVEERQGVKHHMIDVVLPNESYSAWQYATDVKRIIDSTPDMPHLLCGGTGFYADCLLHPLDFVNDDATMQLRTQLQQLYETQGAQPLWDMLKERDEKTYSTIDKNNIKRVIRALEIASSGDKKSEGRRQSDIDTQYNCLTVVLFRDRNNLVRAVERRVDVMLEKGLLAEVERLFSQYPNEKLQSFQAIGYRQFIDFLQKRCNYAEAVERIKIATRQYAKRQNTYFKRMDAVWLNVDEFSSKSEIGVKIAELYQNL